ncbi:uncharacterized protein [Leptinotarsa decemlineata]|uniref:uncharacterized protein n=1 Tax=Leptinotarsa decemlineata TaxID=7539 RepID=UPI003D30777E
MYGTQVWNKYGNFSFSKGMFPSCLKIATIIPLHKGGDLDNPANFRPIALLPVLSKIIEKLSSKGTQDAIFSLMENLYTNLNDRESSAAMFCDLTKAFDCVDHMLLLRKLEVYGFRGSALLWFETYLSHRRQNVLLDVISSEERFIDSGVPQGSVLGPVFFLIYVNYLVHVNISENVYTILNNQEATAAVFCDLSKAFDCVNHGILLQKLEYYGIRGISHKWMTSYLQDREQYVKVSGAVSEEKKLTSGVPQGSALRPILFLLYVNDLTNLNISGRFTLFADDATIEWHTKDKNILGQLISLDLTEIKRWCDANQMVFNSKKTKVLSFKWDIDKIQLDDDTYEI